MSFLRSPNLSTRRATRPPEALQIFTNILWACTFGLIATCVVFGGRAGSNGGDPGRRTHGAVASQTRPDSQASAAPKDLKVFFVDVEGGQATLFVTPAAESLLVDTGWPGNNGRDADRIVAATKKSGISKINYVLITHYHTDHVGGVPQLAARIPIETFIDHGENRETTDAVTAQGAQAYQQLLATGKYKHIVAKPGDLLPIEGIQATVVSADANVIADPLPGAGQENPACKDSPKYPQDTTENRRSVGIVITFGTLRILDLGDLTHDEEMELMCPVNKLGHVDIYIVSHHGWEQSSSPALVYGVAPRVAIMDNGAKKGGSPSVWDIIEKSPGLEDLWQLHFSEEGGSAHNVAPEFIANPDGPDAGNYLELIAHSNGSLAVFNSRTQKTKDYAPRTADAPASPAMKLAPGVELLTPGQGVNFSNYIHDVVEEIKQRWYASMPQDAYLGTKGLVSIRFRIEQNGQIDGPSVEKSCDVDSLNAAALKAVSASTPLRPLPAAFHGPSIDLRMTFFYNLPAEGSR